MFFVTSGTRVSVADRGRAVTETVPVLLPSPTGLVTLLPGSPVSPPSVYICKKKISSNITTVNEHFCFRKKSLNSREPLWGEYLSLRTILKCIYVIYVFCIYLRLLSLAWSQNDSRSGLICNRYINIAKQNHQFFLNKVCEKNTSLSWNGGLLHSNVTFFVSVDTDRIRAAHGGDSTMLRHTQQREVPVGAGVRQTFRVVKHGEHREAIGRSDVRASPHDL